MANKGKHTAIAQNIYIRRNVLQLHKWRQFEKHMQSQKQMQQQSWKWKTELQKGKTNTSTANATNTEMMQSEKHKLWKQVQQKKTATFNTTEVS